MRLVIRARYQFVIHIKSSIMKRVLQWIVFYDDDGDDDDDEYL